MDIKCLSINCHGLRDPAKRLRILAWLKEQRCDVVFLQETHLVADHKPSIQREWDGFVYLSPGQAHSAGVISLFAKHLNITLVSNYVDPSGRLLNTVVEIEDQRLQFCNVYAPNHVSNRSAFFQHLQSILKGGIPTILGGDFNCVEDSFLDKIGGDSDLAVSALRSLQNLTQTYGLQDSFRDLHPSTRLYTWSSADGSISCRLDKFYVSREICCSSCNISFFPFSDHNAVILCFRPPNVQKRGPGVWKLNISLLQHKAYVDKISGFWSYWQLRKMDFRDLSIWWDIGKRKIKHLSITFSRKLAREKRSSRLKLEKELNRLLSTNDSNCNKNEIDRIKAAITDLDNAIISGAKIRSKERFHTEFEKPSKYFFNLENSRQSNKAIQALQTSNSIVTSSAEILDEAATFYEELYANEPIDMDCQEHLLSSIDMCLSDVERESLEGALDNESCFAALSAMKKFKTPGLDGLPAEFYQCFWSKLGDDLVDVLNYSLFNGLFPESMRLALISLLFKKGDRLDLKNWRPISLLNVDYKIGTKTLANRLKTVLPSILNEDQTCGVPGRSIFDNLRLVRDSICYVEQKGNSLAIVKIDQEKAFDRVSWEFLQKILERMNFGPTFRSFIQALYTAVASLVLNNGYKSRKFYLERGVRQGCPLSPLLYSLVAETLGNLIRKNNEIVGLPLPGSQKVAKLSQYADDTTVLVTTEASVRATFESTSIFELGSGSKVNFSPGKSEAMGFGKFSGCSTSIVPSLNWITGQIEILGIHFGTEESIHSSFCRRVDKLEKRVTAWSNRALSLKGKVMIINTIGLSGLIYLSTIFPVPRDVLLRINSIIFNFLWSSKNELVRREIVFQPVANGGLALVNIYHKSQALLLNSLSKIVDQNVNAKWVFLARYWIARSLSKYATLWSFLRSNQIPNSLYRPPIYDTLLSLVHKYEKDLALLIRDCFSVRNNYQLILKSLVVEPRSQFLWTVLTETNSLSWQTIWKTSLSTTLSSGVENDVAWKITHRVLKTLDYVKSWGCKIDGNCKRCKNVPETLDHVFLECPTAIETWIHFKKILISLGSPSFNVTQETVFLRILPNACEKECRPVLTYLIKLICYFIWKCRCEFVYENKIKTSKQVSSEIRREIRVRCEVAFNTSRLDSGRSIKLLTTRNVLAEVENDTLSLKV